MINIKESLTNLPSFLQHSIHSINLSILVVSEPKFYNFLTCPLLVEVFPLLPLTLTQHYS